MAKNRKRIKKRMKRNLYKRYKQTAIKDPIMPLEKTWLNPIVENTKKPKQLKAHLLYDGKYKTENSKYQSQLDLVYGKNVITPVERFVSKQAIIIHSCSKCSTEFYAPPGYLLNGSHDCKATGIGSTLNNYTKQKNKVFKNVNGEELVKSLDRMILSGVKPNLITQKTGVSIEIVKYYKERFHAEVK